MSEEDTDWTQSTGAARLWLERGDLDKAASFFVTALSQAANNSPVESRVELASQLADVLLALGRIEEAGRRLDVARELARRAGCADHGDLVSARMHLATALAETNDFDAALEVCQRLIDDLGDGSTAAGLARSLSARLMLQAGHPPDPILTRLQDAASILERLGEEEHLVSTWLVLGEVQTRMDEAERAESTFRRAISLAETALGSDHPTTAAIRLSLGDLLAPSSESDALLTGVLDAGVPPLSLRALSILGHAHIARGQGDHPRQAWTDALSILESSDEDDPESAARLQAELAQLAVQIGNLDEGEELYSRALQNLERVLPESPPVADVLRGLAGIILLRPNADLAPAEPLLQRALGIAAANFGADDPLVAEVLVDIAGLYHRRGDNAGARKLMERSTSLLDKADDVDGLTLANAYNWLGVVCAELSDPEAAAAAFEVALAHLETVHGADHPSVEAVALNLQRARES